MKALLFHCKRYRVEVGKLANRPKDVAPEKVKEKKQTAKECVTFLVTVEKGDDLKKCCPALAKEVLEVCKDFKCDLAVMLPFAHLSSDLADSKEAVAALDLLEKRLSGKLKIMRSHFGSHKSLLLDVHGHVGNVRFREFH